MSKSKKARDIPDDIKKMSFEEAYQALREATDFLEVEEVDLEKSLLEYSRASVLARHCANLLDEAEDRVRILVESEGVMELTRLDTEDD